MFTRDLQWEDLALASGLACGAFSLCHKLKLQIQQPLLCKETPTTFISAMLAATAQSISVPQQIQLLVLLFISWVVVNHIIVHDDVLLCLLHFCHAHLQVQP